MTDALTLAGERAAAAMLNLWSLDVYDPKISDKSPHADASRAVIQQIIDANGWGTNIKYAGDGPPQWCGMAAGFGWLDAGLDSSWLPSYWASTFRLGLWARYRRFSPKSKANPPPANPVNRRGLWKLTRKASLPAGFVPRLGDVIIVGDGDPDEGDHVTVNIGYDVDKRSFDTISGNGGGVGPRGDKRQGISRRTYSIDAETGYRAMWALRPSFDDLLAEKP